MQVVKSLADRYRRNLRQPLAVTGMLLMGGVVGGAGCGGGLASSVNTAPSAPSAPATYFAPQVAGSALQVPQTYTLDDNAPGAFSQTTYLLNAPEQQEGPQVINAGTLTIGQRGLRSLGITASYAAGGSPIHYGVTTYSPAKTGSFAVELAGQAGGLVQMLGQPAQPLVAAVQCPNLSTAQTYLFITIPAAMVPPGSTPRLARTWDPTAETAYGSVDISSSGSAVTFQKIHQFTLGGTGAPTVPGPSSITGTCAPTFFGNTITVPGQLIVTDPGKTYQTSGQAIMGIGASGGLLVEDNGAGSVQTVAGNPPALDYMNVLGAGTGAVGLPMPSLSSPLNTGSLVGAQYLGFIYTAGADNSQGKTVVTWSSNPVSFGFPGSPPLPSSCSTFAAQPGTLVNGIYGGDMTATQANGGNGGYGNCDFAIDLGPQNPSTAGLYAEATVYVGTGFPAITSGTTSCGPNCFSAVAIAGSINGKYAIFLLGVDSTQPWFIQLLQSN